MPPAAFSLSSQSAARRTAFAAHLANPALRTAFAIGFLILFSFIGVFTYVNFVLVRAPFSIAMMSLGLVYFVFLPSILTFAEQEFAKQGFALLMAMTLAAYALYAAGRKTHAAALRVSLERGA